MSNLARAVIYTEDAYAGGDRRFLDRLLSNSGVVTRVNGLHWTTTYPGGDAAFRATLTAPIDLNHVGLHAGRRVYIVCGGAQRWTGFLDEPQRGDPWQLSGSGLASVATTWGVTANTLDAAIDAAIGRGLSWTRPASLDSTVKIVYGATLASALSDVGRAVSKAWKLTTSGVVSFETAPKTSVDYVLDVVEPLNPSVIGYTQAIGVYTDTGTPVTANNPAAQAKFGYREGTYDMRSLSPSTTPLASGTAQTYLNNWLATNLANWSYTNTLTVQRGQLKVPGGGPVDLATVRAGCTVLVTDVDPSHESLLTPGQLTVLVGATDYDADNDVLTLTPIGMRGQDLLGIMYQALGGAA